MTKADEIYVVASLTPDGDIAQYVTCEGWDDFSDTWTAVKPHWPNLVGMHAGFGLSRPQHIRLFARYRLERFRYTTEQLWGIRAALAHQLIHNGPLYRLCPLCREFGNAHPYRYRQRLPIRFRLAYIVARLLIRLER